MSRITEELREAMHCTNGYSFARDFSFEECCDRIDASFYQLQSENAKLRELVRDMYEMAYPEYPSAFDAAFADRMRELGIEVDE